MVNADYFQSISSGGIPGMVVSIQIRGHENGRVANRVCTCAEIRSERLLPRNRLNFLKN